MKSLKTLLGFSLLALIGVWMGCSSDTSPVASYSASKTAQDDVSPTDPPPTDPPPTDTGDSGLTEGPTSPTPTVVAVPDANLVRVLNSALLDLPEFRTGSSYPPLTATNLAKLKKLDANNQGIVNLTGLQHATGLDTLNLISNSIVSLTPLAGLTGLEYLNLQGNDIADLTPLAGLTGLEYLNLRGNRSFTDITPLAGLTNLTHLDLYTNRIGNISPLAGLTNLEWLAVGHNPLNGNVGPLAGLTKLKLLRVHGTGLQNDGLETLAHALLKLESLNISANRQLNDFEPLVCLENLRWLGLRRMPHVWDRPPIGEGDPKTINDPEIIKDKWIHLNYLKTRGVIMSRY